MNKIKKNWKTILIVLLVLFSLNKCTVSCNRQGIIDKQNIEIVKQDSLIKAQNDSIRILNVELIGKNDKEDALNNAHNLGNDYYTYTINKLNDSIKNLKSSNVSESFNPQEKSPGRITVSFSFTSRHQFAFILSV